MIYLCGGGVKWREYLELACKRRVFGNIPICGICRGFARETRVFSDNDLNLEVK